MRKVQGELNLGSANMVGVNAGLEARVCVAWMRKAMKSMEKRNAAE